MWLLWFFEQLLQFSSSSFLSESQTWLFEQFSSLSPGETLHVSYQVLYSAWVYLPRQKKKGWLVSGGGRSWTDWRSISFMEKLDLLRAWVLVAALLLSNCMTWARLCFFSETSLSHLWYGGNNVLRIKWDGISKTTGTQKDSFLNRSYRFHYWWGSNTK